ncbi:glutamyl-tRNA reductase [Myceligenerans indicum]|uniref:Glutamyl-tRNA reductase n=1 Tax=Myceligenerans indicum TaxID=2593663 RepID=A0ABS1LM19_9MICO|nr:glutamyl-tRNA reductase [Myceligenerans indicum]MBL0887310.1 glutamyl-tRNA reductase [Myceligenerans indicum]
MVLLSLTASHRELDLDALERLSMGSASVGRTVVRTCGPVEGAVVISTCNRFELYLDVDAPLDGHAVGHATHHVAELVAEESGVTTEAAVDSFTIRTGPEVTEHLFSVATGLDSMVVGEREIAGQVKRSLAVAREQETTSKTLELLFQTASRTSKRVGSETELGAAGRSVVSLALDLAEDEVPRWDSARAVLIGTGSYAGASVAALRARGCADIRVYSQSGRAAQFAVSHGVDAVDDLVEALADADVVVSCSGARGRGARGATRTADADASPAAGRHPAPGDRPAAEASLGHVLDAAAVVRARERAADRAGDEPEPGALVILDLALHRDVDPHVVDVEGVLLYDLAGLKAHAPAVARDVVGHARGIVGAAARAFEETRLGREADAAVVALLDEAEDRVRAETDAAVARLAAARTAAGDAGPTPEDADEIARGIRRRVHADLHPRIVAVRAAARERAKAQQAEVIEGAESIAREAGQKSCPAGRSGSA